MHVENIPPRNPEHILELSDDGDEVPKNVSKKSQKSGGKKLKPSPTVIESSDESDHQNKKKTRTANKNTGTDTELEVDENKKETPEEEVGKLLRIKA
jgi:hypothetical protein